MANDSNSAEYTDAVIYCRVSSTKQTTQGDGLGSQESRCRTYADEKGYNVEAVFPDDVSGGGDFMKRPGLVALLSYLDAQPDKNFIVIFDDLKRFARDTEFHIKLRRAFRLRNARIECLNFKFDDTPEGKFIETILAAQGELEREQNGRQVSQKMHARMMNGLWCFKQPAGYVYQARKQGGKVLVRDEPVASIIEQVFIDFASGKFESVIEVVRYLKAQPAWPRSRNGDVGYQRVYDMLTRRFYAGYIDFPKWGISFVKGQHEPLVSMQTWKAAQEQLAGGSKVPARKDINDDFPLRGFVSCTCCSQPMTACWSKGRKRKYPYYFCQTKDCDNRHKSVRREKIEGEFEVLLTGMQPAKELFELVFDVLSDQWTIRLESGQQQNTHAKKELKQLDRKVEQLMDRVVDADSPIMISAYETRIKNLNEERTILAERTAQCGRPMRTFEQTYRTAMEFLSNPQKLWASGCIEDRRLVLKLAFLERLPYDLKRGYRTAENTFPFKALAVFSGVNSRMVGDTGIEPVTPTMSM